MSESQPNLPVSGSPAIFGLRNTVILGVFIVVTAATHALLSSGMASTPTPLHVGTVNGEIHVREQGGVAHHKCDGFKIECYESFVVVYVDRKKEPTWTGDYVLTFPWSKIEYLTMTDPKNKS